MATDYVPAALGDFAQWLHLQKTARRAPGVAAALGYTAADLDRLDQEDDALLLAMATADQKMAAASGAVADRDAQKAAFLTTRRADIAHRKTVSGYTPAIGKSLQWVGPEAAQRGDDLKPTLKATRTGEGFRFDWSKLGQDYLQLFRRPVGATDWGHYLAIDSRSPYIDTETSLRGAYEYYGQLFRDDRPVGQPSDVVVVVWG